MLSVCFILKCYLYCGGVIELQYTVIFEAITFQQQFSLPYFTFPYMFLYRHMHLNPYPDLLVELRCLS